MGLMELIWTGVGLSMDAFAVAICQGLCMPQLRVRQGLLVAVFFGGFQALMPFLGWLLGSQFADKIQSFDHWIAFILLLMIGLNMLREAFGTEDEGGDSCATGALLHRLWKLLLLAIATSIDALAVGVTFAFLDVRIEPAVALIGVITFVISFGGVVVGNFFGARYKKGAEIVGGVILVLLGVKILLDHLGIL